MSVDSLLKPPAALETSLLTGMDIHLFREGTHSHLYRKLGCHLRERDGVAGAHFAVWAPNAVEVSVICEANDWRPGADRLFARPDESGIWEGFVAGIAHGQAYKYRIVPGNGRPAADKADPFAFYAEVPPAQASRAWQLDYAWGDDEWMGGRARKNALDAPISIYEVHLGSWRRGENDRLLGYREIAAPLVEHVRAHGFTHVEFLPLTEHPFYGSWGYQCTGYFAATARYGAPQDLMYLIDVLHQHGIGVILDWVPSHFPGDAFGLIQFDGTSLYEHADRRQGFHPDWNSWIFNYGRHEVRAFLISSAIFWLERYHVDAIRVDAVASMLYLDYGRRDREWIPNRYGGRENLDAIAFLRQFNEAVYREFPDVQTIAEESTAWPAVSKPTYAGGLGFGLKWNMGWMHDTLAYFAQDPVYRRFHHDKLTFSIWYAFAENFLLPLSHDEVVYGKRSLIGRMPGDEWRQFANLRALYGYLWTHPGKKLLFMGGELGQRNEWSHDREIDWPAAADELNRGVQRWIGDLNRVYVSEPALHQVDFEPAGFEWIDCRDTEASVIAFLRRPWQGGATMLVICNFTPVPRENYLIGVPHGGVWQEILNSDASIYGGSGMGNLGAVEAAPVPAHGRYHSLTMRLPPLAVVLLRAESAADA